MKLLRKLDKTIDISRGVVATIGNFDGVHLGHQALLAELSKEADRLKLPMLVMLFEPQPGEYFQGQKLTARLTSLREKLDCLKRCKVDYVYCLKFNEKLASMSAVMFANYYFFSSQQVKYLLIGADFRFGHERSGDVDLLKTMGAKAGCTVQAFPDFTMEKTRVSSTKIRALLAEGQLDKAALFLGRTFSLCGRVIKGDGRGRQWGIPTANLSMRRLSLPLKGVYCVKVLKENKQWLYGVANLGSRPTVDGTKNILEIHLFDFNENIYGEMLKVYFLYKLRDELKFSSIEVLVNQIHNDITDAKLVFSKHGVEFNDLIE